MKIRDRKTITFSGTDGLKKQVAARALESAREMDTNRDGALSDREILKGAGVDLRRKERPAEDRAGLLNEYKCWLAGAPNPYRQGYSSYAEVGQQLEKRR